MLLDIAMLLLGVILTAGTFVFVSAEFSLVALDQAVVESRAAAGDARARQVSTAIKNLSTQLSGAQVGITLTTILLGYTTQSALADMLSAAGVGLGLSTAVSSAVGVAVAAVLINVLSMVFGELVPKNLALAHPLKTAGRIVPFNSLFTVVFKPVITVLNASANGILRLMGVEPQEELSSARSASELAAMVRHSAQEGTLDTSTASLFTNSIRISELNAADVMTDRGLLHTIPEDAVASDVVRAAHETGHSRFPVIGEDRDDIIGFVSLRRAVAVPFEKRDEVPVISSSLLASCAKKVSRWPWSLMNTVACRESSPLKMSSKKLLAMSRTSMISVAWVFVNVPMEVFWYPDDCASTNSRSERKFSFPMMVPMTLSPV